MDILAIIKGLLSLATFLAKKAHDKQLIDAGMYKAIAMNNHDSLQKIRRASDARRDVKYDADSLRNDPNNRDN